MTIRVLLVDDHPILRKGIKDLLSKVDDIEVIGEAENGDEAIHLVNQLNPDVLLLDMEMPLKNGLEVTSQLKAAGSKVSILGFSAYNDREIVRSLLLLGADGYITKDEPFENIVAAIRGAAGGEKGWFSRKSKAIVMDIYRNDDHWSNKVSPRESQVCKLIVEGKTNKEIANDLKISEKTVEKYVTHLFQKLNVYSRVELAVMVFRDQSQ